MVLLHVVFGVSGCSSSWCQVCPVSFFLRVPMSIVVDVVVPEAVRVLGLLFGARGIFSMLLGVFSIRGCVDLTGWPLGA